ncbi:hypothetical protein SCWH03_52710 [Streptomyces pacificus]|uniref:Uncharacterized protein n=1 Tax=Streptomyces pacificus TaxID=2705029 RepID=A0A6A0B1L8_9ACTN|nr:hypothetical protein SCWH03_52710 [Streptomyces pacificus]
MTYRVIDPRAAPGHRGCTGYRAAHSARYPGRTRARAHGRDAGSVPAHTVGTPDPCPRTRSGRRTRARAHGRDVDRGARARGLAHDVELARVPCPVCALDLDGG